MTDASGGEPRREAGGGIGARLRAARERSAFTLTQAAQRLHVASETLEALEAERFEELGAPIYVKGYLSRYAELIGESPEALLDLLAASTMAAPDLTRIPRAAKPDNRVSALLAIIGIAAGVALAVALAWWGWMHLYRREAVVIAARPEAMAVPNRSQQHAAAHSTVPAAASSPAPAPAAAQDTRIALSFPVASWVDVTDAGGRSLYHGMVAAGARKRFSGPAPLHVVLGYADGVSLSVNGRAVALARYIGRDHAVSIAVAADGRIAPAPLHARHAGG